MINSEHSYERLNWNVTLYKPLFFLGKNSHNDLSDCKDVKEIFNDFKEGCKLGLGLVRTQPGEINTAETPFFVKDKTIHNNIPSAFSQPQILIRDTRERMENSFKITEGSYFLSLTVPPDTILTKHKKKFRYHQLKIDDQIRFLRNLIYKTISDLTMPLNNYIITFEITKQGQIHAHMVADFNCHPSAFRSIYGSLLNCNNYKKCEINCNIKPIKDKEVFDYLCKIKYI